MRTSDEKELITGTGPGTPTGGLMRQYWVAACLSRRGRRVALRLPRPEFGVDGQCLDMPNEPAGSNFKDKVWGRAYPIVERAGAGWAYLGPRETLPSLPAHEIFDCDEGDVSVVAYQPKCNWLQGLPLPAPRLPLRV